MLFLKRLAIESNIKAQESKEKTLQAHHVNAVLRVSHSNREHLNVDEGINAQRKKCEDVFKSGDEMRKMTCDENDVLFRLIMLHLSRLITRRKT